MMTTRYRAKSLSPPFSAFSLLWLCLTKLPLEFNSQNSQFQMYYSIHRCWLDSKWEKLLQSHSLASNWLWICDEFMVEMKVYEFLHWPLHFTCFAKFQGRGRRGNILCSYFTSKERLRAWEKSCPQSPNFNVQHWERRRIQLCSLPRMKWLVPSNFLPNL